MGFDTFKQSCKTVTVPVIWHEMAEAGMDAATMALVKNVGLAIAGAAFALALAFGFGALFSSLLT